jgi:hypothetical protein
MLQNPISRLGCTGGLVVNVVPQLSCVHSPPHNAVECRALLRHPFLFGLLGREAQLELLCADFSEVAALLTCGTGPGSVTGSPRAARHTWTPCAAAFSVRLQHWCSCM